MKNYCEEILIHHGILGMKWGVRRYQNKDGTLTDKGKKRLEKMRNRGVKNSEYAISIIEKSKSNNQKKFDKISSKHSDKPKHINKQSKYKEKIIEDNKNLKRLTNNLKKLKNMTINDFSEKAIMEARSLADSIVAKEAARSMKAYQLMDEIQRENNRMFTNNAIRISNQNLMDTTMHSINSSINMSMGMHHGFY